MSQVVRCGLTQLSNPIHDDSRPVSEIRGPRLQKPRPYIGRSERKGVPVLGLQEVVRGSSFCPGQDTRWDASAEPVPGPSFERCQPMIASPFDRHRRPDA
jgi:N-carbamoylputrescine amidase